MKILSLNQDKGIGTQKKKGASVHLSAIRAAFSDLGHTVVEMDDPSNTQLSLASASYSLMSPFDLLYERYALGKTNGANFAAQHSIRHILEVNAPLAEEAQRWRGTSYNQSVELAEQQAFANAHHIIAVSEDTKRYSIERGAKPNKITVIPNGFDPSVFYPRDRQSCKARLGIRKESFVVGFHGRLRPWHRFNKLVDAIAQLRRQQIPVHLLSIGEGDYISCCQASLSADEYTHFDWVDLNHLGDLVGAYDVLPLMYTDDEPCYFSPLKLFEAMACGAVPVVPNVGTPAQLLHGRDSGLVYEKNQLAESIQQLYLDPVQLNLRRSACIEQAKSNTWRQVAKTTLSAAHL